MAHAERRIFPRVPLNVEIDYKKISRPEKTSDPGIHSEDISESGIRILALEELNPDTMLELKFSLPGLKEPICVTGTTVWIDEFTVGTLSSSKAYEVGIKFDSISPEDRNKINQFVSGKL
jgi:c-di-GMP-binding flagellar brake protein YcgR